MEIKSLEWQRQEIIVDAPLYKEFDLTGVSNEDFAQFVLGSGSVDAYCIECEKMSVFSLGGVGYSIDEKAKQIPKYGIIPIKAVCARRAEKHSGKCPGELHVCFYRDGDKMTKIGQYPSKADLDFGSLDPIFSKELERELRSELGRAVGLRAHGIGIGSFVYLRRIFEKLIGEAHTSAKSDSQWDESAYEKARVPERIKMLRSHLPNRLVENAQMYGILSKGVHDLSEEECLHYFAIVQKGILMILKERHEEREHQNLVKDLKQQVDKVKQKQN